MQKKKTLLNNVKGERGITLITLIITIIILIILAGVALYLALRRKWNNTKSKRS